MWLSGLQLCVWLVHLRACVFVLIKSDKWRTQRKRWIPARLLFLWETSLKKADINNGCHPAILPAILHFVCDDVYVCVCVSPLLTVSHRRKSAKKTKVKDVFILTHTHTQKKKVSDGPASPQRHVVKCVWVYVVCVCSIICSHYRTKSQWTSHQSVQAPCFHMAPGLKELCLEGRSH